jgi:hypothetical protein
VGLLRFFVRELCFSYVFLYPFSYTDGGSYTLNCVQRFFLLDYKPLVPMLLWEGIDMTRKLLLSVIGSFWSRKSAMCIVTALLISFFFLILHTIYKPYRVNVLNQVQTVALTVLTLLYLVGFMLKANTVEQSDQEDLGLVMVAIVVSLIMAVIAYLVFEVRAVMQWIHTVRYARAAMKPKAVFDPALQDHVIDVTDLEMRAVLGQGSERVVRKAIYANTEVAVKELLHIQSSSSSIPVEELLHEAQLEAQVLQQLSHPVG